ASLQPVVADTLAGVARETDGLRQAVAQAVERQLTQLSSGFEAASTHAADSWRSALDAQRQANEALAAGLGALFARSAQAQGRRGGRPPAPPTPTPGPTRSRASRPPPRRWPVATKRHWLRPRRDWNARRRRWSTACAPRATPCRPRSRHGTKRAWPPGANAS